VLNNVVIVSGLGIVAICQLIKDILGRTYHYVNIGILYGQRETRLKESPMLEESPQEDHNFVLT
jgi:hypothetical protein